jgi:hypothetical protein
LSPERIEAFWKSTKKAKPTLQGINLPDNYQTLLATPMMLTLFANTCAVKQESAETGRFQFKPFKINTGPKTKGELIYNYILCQLLKLANNEQRINLYFAYVALFWFAPYAAWRMENKGLFSEEKMTMRQNVEDYLVKNETFIRSRASTFLAKAIERHKIRIPDKPFKELLVNPSHPDTPSLTDLLVEVFCLLSTEDRRAEKERYTFRHQHFRDFLSALHIDNTLDMALSDSKNFIIPEAIKDRVLPQYVTDMLGGIMEDYLNSEKPNHSTHLHMLLNCLRGLDSTQAGFAVNNVIGVWRTARKDQILKEDLTNLDLTNVPLNGILFSKFHLATHFNRSKISDATFLFFFHCCGIKRVMYNRSGSQILSASIDGTVKEWDRKTGECIRTYRGHTNCVEWVVYSPDGSCILSASCDWTVKEWNRKTGKCIRTFKEHTNFVNYVVYSPDGSCILSASWDRTIREWSRTTGECLRTFEGHTDYVNRAVYSKDGNHIISASRDDTVREWDRKTGKCIRTFKEHTDYP